MGKIHFLGGVHGAGKSTISKKICLETNLQYLSASDIIRLGQKPFSPNKNVENILDTQNRLILGINQIIEPHISYILDGHFCLFNSNNRIEKIPTEIYKKINPKTLAVAIFNIEIIKKRLEARDNKTYSVEVLEEMQLSEIEHAKEIAAELDVPFIEIKNGDFQKYIEVLQ